MRELRQNELAAISGGCQRYVSITIDDGEPTYVCIEEDESGELQHLGVVGTLPSGAEVGEAFDNPYRTLGQIYDWFDDNYDNIGADVDRQIEDFFDKLLNGDPGGSGDDYGQPTPDLQ